MQKQNIIFILIDDMGWKDLSCYGSDFYETPNIDNLAQSGMLFTDAYAASPVCSPTRASILSGKYPANVGVTDWIGAHSRGKLLEVPYVDHLPLEEKSLASTMKENGYHTWHVGKWHLGDERFYPQHHGFDVNIAGCHMGRPKTGYFSPYNIEHLENGPKGEFLNDRLTDEAIKLINKKDEKPFFLHLSHYAVHTPIEAKKEDINKFKIKAKKMGLNKKKTFQKGEYFPSDEKHRLRVKRRLVQSDAAYAGLVWNLDENIGRLIDALKRANQLENTVIFFTSDNGGLSTAEGSPTCNAPLNEGKGWMYEGGVREPLIVSWPGRINPGSICRVPVTSPDFYPTILDIAGIALMPEQHQDGVSIKGLLLENESFEREAIYWHYPHYGNQGGTPGSSIRMSDWKLIKFYEDNRLELYNLKQDIGETINVYQENQEIGNHMLQLLEAWLEKVDGKIPKLA
ncbi:MULTISPECIES: sulfatase [unclassified Fusibacter]|uniref:sulfatase n=1 Tax=unclassified Fusibacter TaxID=2624464 RepID=UPI0010121171|nr:MULTISPECIES: sulfatase [unclassified Fusibacter]MCK8061625.1 sulfatase [Fusibacter sp. A2]NPE23808.1 sulfatase [Fusibacter sp. A1]RXV58646.1 DUF4976 domain-containing protein [Fusibacter sp. A1]